MLVSDLNKIINLFLVGSLTAIVLVVIFIEPIAPILWGVQETFQFFIAIVTLASIPIIFFLGMIVDSIAELFIRNSIIEKHSENSEKLCENLFIKESQKENNTVRDIFVNLLRKTDHLKLNLEIGTNFRKNEKYVRNAQIFAAAIFQKTASSNQHNWLIQHYSLYILASNYIVLIFLFFIGISIKNYQLIILFPIHFIVFTVTIFTIIFLLLRNATEKHLYTYQLAYRHGMLVLSEMQKIQPNEYKDKFK